MRRRVRAPCAHPDAWHGHAGTSSSHDVPRRCQPPQVLRRLRGAADLRATLPGTDTAFLMVCPAASKLCLTMAVARFLAASVALSFMALVASCVNCLVSAPHHCIGS